MNRAETDWLKMVESVLEHYEGTVCGRSRLHQRIRRNDEYKTARDQFDRGATERRVAELVRSAVIAEMHGKKVT